MSPDAAASADPADALRDLFDTALPRVYGYLISRCGRVPVAEDLTARDVPRGRRRGPARRFAPVSVPWLIGVARHKLVDHWRRQAREERSLRAVADTEEADDPWDVELDALQARTTLEQLAPHHRAALTLRYLDDLPVPQVAELLDRSVHSTEGLLVRARASFAGPTAVPSGAEPDAERRRAMPDPFERLRAPVTPVDPDPAFAVRLRARLERALSLPRGVPVTAVDLDRPRTRHHRPRDARGRHPLPRRLRRAGRPRLVRRTCSAPVCGASPS